MNARSDGFLSNAKALWSTTNALPDSIAQSHRKPTRGRHLLSWQTNHVAFTSNLASCLQKQSAQLAHLHRFQQNAAGKSGHWQCKGLAQNWSGFALGSRLRSGIYGILWHSMAIYAISTHAEPKASVSPAGGAWLQISSLHQAAPATCGGALPNRALRP